MKPLNLAHRGASAYAPENTLAAFALALELGADGVELDVTVTRDRVPVVIHDDTVDRTTDGTGYIKNMTLDQVNRLDAGAHFPKYRGERIPTLHQVLEKVGSRGIVNIELKSKGLRTDGLEHLVAQVVHNFGNQVRVVMSSFNPLALARMWWIDPALDRGLLYAPDSPLYLRRAWLRPLVQPVAMHPRHDMVSEAYCRWASAKHLKTNTWTTDDPKEMNRLCDLGVHAIMTNKPDILRQVIEKRA